MNLPPPKTRQSRITCDVLEWKNNQVRVPKDKAINADDAALAATPTPTPTPNSAPTVGNAASAQLGTQVAPRRTASRVTICRSEFTVPEAYMDERFGSQGVESPAWMYDLARVRQYEREDMAWLWNKGASNHKNAPRSKRDSKAKAIYTIVFGAFL